MSARKSGILYLLPAPLRPYEVGAWDPAALSQSIPAAALRLFSTLDRFIVESERMALRLLSRLRDKEGMERLSLGILNEHSSESDIPGLLQAVLAGNDCGFFTEAGMPCIADPGAALVSFAHSRGVKVVPVSGPSSIILALTASGLDAQRFAFSATCIRKRLRRAAIQRVARDIKQDGMTRLLSRRRTGMKPCSRIAQPSCRMTWAVRRDRALRFLRKKVLSMPASLWRAGPLPRLGKAPAVFLFGQKASWKPRIRARQAKRAAPDEFALFPQTDGFCLKDYRIGLLGVEFEPSIGFSHEPQKPFHRYLGNLGEFHAHGAGALFERGYGEFPTENPYFSERKQGLQLFGHGAKPAFELLLEPIQLILPIDGRDFLVDFHFDHRHRYIGIRDIAAILQLQIRLFLFLGRPGKGVDGVIEQLKIHVEADREYISGLLPSEEVSSSSHFQVLHGDLESGTQFGEIGNYLQPFHRDFAESAFVRIEKKSEGLPVRSADPSPQLVKLRNPVEIGAINDNRVDIGNIDPILDDCRRDEDMEGAVNETVHYVLKLGGIHLSMGGFRQCFRNDRAYELLDLGQALDPVVEIKHLAAPLQLAPDGARDDFGVELFHVGLYRLAGRGGVWRMDISRIFSIDMWSVRGIGVAVRVRQSMPAFISLSLSLSFTPKRCSSSMTSRPKSLKATSFCRIRCVPTTISMLPASIPWRIFFCCFLSASLESMAIWIG